MPARSSRSPAWCGRTWRSSPRSSRCTSNSSARSTPSPTPRPRSSSASSRAAARSSTATIRNMRGWRIAPRTPGSGASCRSASTPRPMRRLLKCSLQADRSTVQARILGTDVTYKLGAPGRHVVLNSLAVLAAAALVGADLALAALALAELQPAAGRGARVTLELPGGAALLIDESYNANPASMRAALALLGQSEVGPRGRRMAVLGDMLELGAARRRPASRTGRAGGRPRHRSRLLLRAADAQPVGRPSLRAPGRLCRNLGRARAAGACRHPAGRRHHGQRIARLPDGAHRQGARKPLSPPRGAGRACPPGFQP